YEARGDVQLYVDMVQPEGLGLQQLELERLKAKLQAEGLFDEARKRPLPRFPQRIGVVTSPQGAVLHDIISVIGRRYPAVELVIAPTRVQGDGAAEEIVAALESLNALSDIDVVIVARGGGSAEDLSAFNAEAVARAVYGSRAPVVSAVGHETDVTLVDFVADRRAPTPSAAAEMVVPDRLELRAAITADEKRLVAAMADAIAQRRQQVHHAAGRMAARVPDVAQRRQRVDDLLRSATAHLRATLALRRERVRGLALQIASLSPARTLSRGYAVVERDGGTPVVSVAQVRPGDPITVHVSDGRFGGVVR
ncbi:MAG: exodeoxyribonuclease VII large subunit, partial [Chloroflexota bacterium]